MSDIKIYANVIEEEALEQIKVLSEQKAFKNEKIRIMPDVHAGKGCVIGFTSSVGDYVIPNVVGVDIGCGMLTIELGNIDIDLKKLDDVIREFVPSGMSVHDESIYKFEMLKKLKCYKNLRDTQRIERSIGTLGGGNHFIEVDIDDAGNKYLIIHTGSRNLGKQVAEYYQNLAYEMLYGGGKLAEEQKFLIAEYKAQGRKNEIQQALKNLKLKYKADDLDIPKDLAYLTGKHKHDYLHDMLICQEYAKYNRATIANVIGHMTGFSVQNRFETVHNYINIVDTSFKDNIIRKGAISANKGEKLLIPLNMRDGCILGVGKGNADWNNSAPHGAGRLMSRSKAREQFTVEEYKESMAGIFTTSISDGTIDELPMAYKNMDDIIGVIGDTVEILKIIKPIYNFKADDSPSFGKKSTVDKTAKNAFKDTVLQVKGLLGNKKGMGKEEITEFYRKSHYRTDKSGNKYKVKGTTVRKKSN